MRLSFRPLVPYDMHEGNRVPLRFGDTFTGETFRKAVAYLVNFNSLGSHTVACKFK